MAVTYPVVVYGQASSIDTTPRLIRTIMGDGNQAIIVNGINFLDESGQLEHPLLEAADAATLRTFLKTYCNGTVVTIVNWMEDYTGATTMNVILTGYRQAFDGVTYTFTVSYEKVNRTS